MLADGTLASWLDIVQSGIPTETVFEDYKKTLGIS